MGPATRMTRTRTRTMMPAPKTNPRKQASASAMQRSWMTTETSALGTTKIPRTPRSAATTVLVPWTSAAPAVAVSMGPSTRMTMTTRTRTLVLGMPYAKTNRL